MAAKRQMGPGPGAYRLPTTVGFIGHDPSRHRNPMYSLGARGAFIQLRSTGPGPVYRIGNVTRDGIVTSPAWTLGSRYPYMRGYAMTPGPGAHAPERCPPTKDQRAPAYSLGARWTRGVNRPGGPAPNAYTPRMGRNTPAWTLGARYSWQSSKAQSPGPAVYFQKNQDIYKTRLPSFSLGARGVWPGTQSTTPGPAAYPPNLYNVKRNTYSYSFGRKHSEWAPPMIIKEDTMDCL